jgi:hypothetical protein
MIHEMSSKEKTEYNSVKNSNTRYGAMNKMMVNDDFRKTTKKNALQMIVTQ